MEPCHYGSVYSVAECQNICNANEMCEGAHVITSIGHCCMYMNLVAKIQGQTVTYRQHELSGYSGWEYIVNSRSEACGDSESAPSTTTIVPELDTDAPTGK